MKKFISMYEKTVTNEVIANWRDWYIMGKIKYNSLLRQIRKVPENHKNEYNKLLI